MSRVLWIKYVVRTKQKDALLKSLRYCWDLNPGSPVYKTPTTLRLRVSYSTDWANQAYVRAFTSSFVHHKHVREDTCKMSMAFLMSRVLWKRSRVRKQKECDYAWRGTAGIWTQGLLFTRQALSPAKPQYLHESHYWSWKMRCSDQLNESSKFQSNSSFNFHSIPYFTHGNK